MLFRSDVLSYNPWHGVREHQPLGSIMRVRIAAYERSTRYRHEMNAQPRIEPASLAECSASITMSDWASIRMSACG